LFALFEVCGNFPRKGELGAYVDHRIAQLMEETIMTWNTPTLIEICIGLEINGYLPAEF
jgi:coenzyme PQQ precursor peptide PqqA